MSDRYTLQNLAGESLILTGVSGGPDSLCLLGCLHAAGFQTIVAHFDHQLRLEANQETEFVRGVADRMGLQFVGGSGDVRTYAEEHKLSLEEAARLLRYQFLFSQARLQHASVVAVGHTADDQVETILMHFLRGAGLAGLKGMTGRTLLSEFDLEIPLVRPILHLWRNETESYCLAHKLEPVIDSSNTDESYFRNRLRHSLIPELEKYNPRFKETLLRTARSLAGDFDVITEVVDLTWTKVVCGETAELISFRSSVLEEIPVSMLRNILRKAMITLRPTLRTLDFATLERASNFIKDGQDPGGSAQLPQQVDLIDGFFLYREGQVTFLATHEADLPSEHWPLIEDEFEVHTSGNVDLNKKFNLSIVEVELETARACALENKDPFSAWLDADVTGDVFTVRTRRSGDDFSPLGMNRQTVKLREFYIKVKMPRRARSGWPIVCSGKQVAWVPGFRIAHPFQITESTTRVVKLTIQPR